MTMYQSSGKRLFDFVWAAVFVVVLSPVWVVVAVLILLDDGPPVFFKQARVGKAGEIFEMIEFRSMPVGSAEIGSADASKIQIMRLGELIRRTSIGELPQSVNIFKGATFAGDFSIIARTVGYSLKPAPVY